MPGVGEQAATWTLPVAASVFLLLVVLETHRPRQVAAMEERWVVNAALFGLVVLTGAIFAPARMAGFIWHGWDAGPLMWVQRQGGPWVALASGLIVLDGLSYALHRLQHTRLLWRFHAVHHSDHEMDATTALRHHPGEYLVNALVAGLLLGLLGLPGWIVPVYGLLVLLQDLWTHANIALPSWFEDRLSVVLVTPGWHRVHHSREPAHFGSNYGSILTAWDRLFGTAGLSVAGPLKYGVPELGHQNFWQAIVSPFRSGNPHALQQAEKKRDDCGVG